MTREPARVTVSAGMESTSLVNMVSQGHSAEHQTHSLVHNIKIALSLSLATFSLNHPLKV